VFVSFDYDNDKHYKYLLEAWHAHPRFRFTFADVSSGEIDSSNVGRIKAALTSKINLATHTLVIVGRYANSLDPRRHLIGYRNWINFEVARSKAAYNRLVAVRLDPGYELPEELVGSSVAIAPSFTEAAIVNALDRA
jgi:hypothetical protein